MTIEASLESVVADLVARAKERECTLTDAFLPEDLSRLEDDELRKAARVGILKMAGDVMHNERGTTASAFQALKSSSEQRRTPRTYTSDGRNPATSTDPLMIFWTSANGTPKTLSDFTVADCESLRLDCIKKEVGWRKKKDWADKAMAALRRARVSSVGLLPQKNRLELRELAAGAWS